MGAIFLQTYITWKFQKTTAFLWKLIQNLWFFREIDYPNIEWQIHWYCGFFGFMKYSCLLQTLFMFQNCNRYIDSNTYNILYVKHMRSEKVYKWIASMFEHTIIPQRSLAHSYSSNNKPNTNKTFEEKKWE